MYTIAEFTSEWKRIHRPSMNVNCDVAFFYGIYVKLHRLAEQDTAEFDEQFICSLLLYIENTIAVGLDGVYEYRYRSVGDAVCNWCENLGMGTDTTLQVDKLVSDAATDAPCSALRQWMTESVLSGDFSRLSEMLAWFAREDRILRYVYPDLRYRKAMFMRLAEGKQASKKMLWADLAFNWRDKRGYSLANTIAKQFRFSSPDTGKEERALLKEVAELLDSIRSERLDTYTVIERKDEHMLTLLHRDGRMFQNVIIPMPIPENMQSRYLAAQLVTYNNQTYINGPTVWLNKEALPVWNGETNWSDILRKEQDAAKQVYFTTTSGKRMSLYEDLYSVPEDLEEAYYADMGIHFDEPNIFDFLEGLKAVEMKNEK